MVWLSLHQHPDLVVQLRTLMFSPSLKKNFEVLWPLLTSAALCFDTRSRLCLRLTQISPGKNANLHPIYPPHLPPCAPGSGWASFCLANSPAQNGLLCDFCSSGQGFAVGFLQIPPRGGQPCLGLTLLAAKRVADLHRRVSAHAGRTKKNRRLLLCRKRLLVFVPVNDRIKIYPTTIFSPASLSGTSPAG